MATELTFPLHGASEKNKARIRFQPIEIKGASVSFLNNKANAERNNSTDGQNGAQDLELASANTGGFDVGFKGTTEIISGRPVTLYMPPNIQIGDGVNISSTDFGAINAAGSDALGQAGGSLASFGKDAAIGTFNSVLDAIKGTISSDAAGVLAGRAAGKFGEGRAGAIQGATRVTTNPNTRMLFRNVNIREFAFDFEMTPASVKESNNIKNIISLFRSELYPTSIRSDAAFGTNNTNIRSLNFGYRFPNMFEIKMYYGDEDMSLKNPNLAFKRMFLQSFRANYNTERGSFYAGGDFSKVQISMQFTEAVTLDKQSVQSDIDGSNIYEAFGT